MPRRGEYSGLETAVITKMVGRTDDPTTELFLGNVGAVPSGPESERPVDPGEPFFFWNEDIPALQFWFDPPGVWITMQEFPSFFQGDRPGPTTTVLTTLNVYEKVTGVLTASGFELGFTLGGAGTNEWTFTSPDRATPIALEARGAAEKAAGGLPETMEFTWHLNGNPIGASGFLSTRQNEPGTWDAVARLLLDTNDVVDLRVRNVTGVSDVIVLALSELGGG